MFKNLNLKEIFLIYKSYENEKKIQYKNCKIKYHKWNWIVILVIFRHFFCKQTNIFLWKENFVTQTTNLFENTLKQWKNRKTQNVCKKLKTNFDPWLVKSRRKSRNIEIYIGSSLALRPCPTLDKILGFVNF